VSVVGGRTSSIKAIADSSGDFTYTMNQEHELFAGPIPLGTYTIHVTDGKIVATFYIGIGSPPAQ
jgi:peroxiredoxin